MLRKIRYLFICPLNGAFFIFNLQVGVSAPTLVILIKAVNPDSKLISDMFTIMITDKAAIPFGVVAQKAMYQAQEKK